MTTAAAIVLAPTRTVSLALTGANGSLRLNTGAGIAVALDPIIRGAKGDKGDTGDAGPGAGPIQSLQGIAGPALGGHRAVGMDDTGVYRYASNATPADVLRVAGITVGAAASGAAVSVQTNGPITEPSWSWTPDAPVYLGQNGGLTQTAPTLASGAVFSMAIGIALTPTSMFLRLNTPIYL